MKIEEMTPFEIAQYHIIQIIENFLSWNGYIIDKISGKKIRGCDREVKRINNKTHLGILKVSKYIDKTFPESMAIIDEIGKIDVPEAQMRHIKLSIAFGVNTEDAFKRLRKMLFKGKYDLSVEFSLKDIAWRTNKFLCYNLPNVNQKNIKYYDKEFLKKQLAVLDEKNGGPVDLT